MVEQLREIHRQLAESLVRLGSDQGQRVRIPLAAASYWRPLGIWLLARYAGRQDGRALRHGPESGSRSGKRPAAAYGTEQAEVAGRARFRRDRNCFVLVRLAGD